MSSLKQTNKGTQMDYPTKVWLIVLMTPVTIGIIGCGIYAIKEMINGVFFKG